MSFSVQVELLPQHAFRTCEGQVREGYCTVRALSQRKANFAKALYSLEVRTRCISDVMLATRHIKAGCKDFLAASSMYKP